MTVSVVDWQAPPVSDEALVLENLRSDLEDSLKEYSELDLLVELLQNALDALDERRFRDLCGTLSVDPADDAIVAAWNQTVDDLVASDCAAFPRDSGWSSIAVWQRQAADKEQRRLAWFRAVVGHLNLDESALDLLSSYNSDWAELHVGLDLTGPNVLTVADSGVGIPDVLNVVRHKGSTKRGTQRPKRRGVRGSHGWGLSAVLAQTDRLEIATHFGGELRGYSFRDFASFRLGTVDKPTVTELDKSELGDSRFDFLRGHVSGTQVRVWLPTTAEGGLVQKLTGEGTIEQWSNMLRLFTPVGQVNDYVMHPAFHTLRDSDLSVQLRIKRGQDETSDSVPYSYLKLGDLKSQLCDDLPDYVDRGMPSGFSVYCVGREERGGSRYLVAAEIQASKPTLASIVDGAGPSLVEYSDDSGSLASRLPTGIYLALSGGMRSESLALAPLSTHAAYRGVILSETARPTLGRRHTMDQRTAIPGAAKAFASRFDGVRKKTIPSGQPVLTGPALNQWQRRLWKKVLEDLAQEPPLEDLRIWAVAGSGEARVMLAYAELLALGTFGDARVLRASLGDVYDFQFVYRWEVHGGSAPSPQTGQLLVAQGFAVQEGSEIRRLAIGEFKAQGESLIEEFDGSGSDWRKNPNTIDLLVCWDFDEQALGEKITSHQVTSQDHGYEFEGQTDVWEMTADHPRSRPLAVARLSLLRKRLLDSGAVLPASNWSDTVGTNYFD